MRLAVIPARGGSKRIPRKNIRPFAGRPIICWSIAVAQASGLFDRIVVSTDDREIAEVARAAGADVPFMRPPELADDFTGTNAVVKHAIQWHRSVGQQVTYACCIYATAPLMEVRFLHEGFERLVESGKSFAFSVTSFAFPIQRALRIRADGSVEAIWPENISKRSQDLDEAWHDAGQFYWGTAQAFVDELVTYSPDSVAIRLPRHLVQDIDTEEDWARAEAMAQAIRRTGFGTQ